jgi:hypothetical protein
MFGLVTGNGQERTVFEMGDRHGAVRFVIAISLGMRRDRKEQGSSRSLP